MRKFYLILCLIIPSQFLIGQSKSIVLEKIKNGKQYIINEGDKIAIKLHCCIDIYNGDLKFSYDSSSNDIKFQIENHTISIDEIKYIKYYKDIIIKRIYPELPGKGYGLLALGVPLEVLSIYAYQNSWCCDEIFIPPVILAGLMTTSGLIRLIKSKTKKKYKISVI